MVRAQAPGALEDGVCREEIPNDPDDLEEDDPGLESRAARAPRQSRAQKAAPSDSHEAAASSKQKPRRKGRKRKAVSQPEYEEDDELGEG